ncbi:MAG: MBL fold metallo-hydrolase, partial [Halobacteria archaeon]|nr:MBL fold metallo-hydrolase [Halobacteria archaeon]
MEIDNLNADSLGFTSNVFLVYDEDGDGRTVLVDAGNDETVVEKIKETTGSLDALVLTHTHPDHVGQLSRIKDEFGVD